VDCSVIRIPNEFLELIGLHEIVIWKVDMNLGDISTRANVCKASDASETGRQHGI
jgi:hypothetical protein